MAVAVLARFFVATMQDHKDDHDSGGGHSDLSDVEQDAMASVSQTECKHELGQAELDPDEAAVEGQSDVVPGSFWSRHVLEFFAPIREKLGETLRGVRMWSGCSGIWSEGAAMKACSPQSRMFVIVCSPR